MTIDKGHELRHLLHASKLGTETVELKNPSTGEVESIRSQEPLTDSEMRSVRAALQEAGAQGPDEHGHAVISFGDGGAAEVYMDGLETGCCVTPSLGLTPDCRRFLMDLLNVAEWVMLPAMEGNPAIVSSPGMTNAFNDSFTEVVCGSHEELGAILSGGYNA
jgi:hypothetical protein